MGLRTPSNKDQKLLYLDKELNKNNLNLRQNDKFFSDNQAGLMCTHCLKGNLRSASSYFLEAIGYTKEDILTCSIAELLTDAYYTKLQAYLRLIKIKGRVSGEVSVISKTGDIINLIFTSVLATDANGNRFILVDAFDITKRSELEKNLRSSNELFYQMNEVARVGGWEYYIDTKKFYGTIITRELFGVDSDYLPRLERDINFFKAGEHRKKIVTAMERAMANGTSFDLELQIVNKKGRELWLRAMCKAEIKNGKPYRLFGVIQDIDEKKKSQIQITKSKDLLDRTNKVALIGGWEFEIDTNTFSWTSFTKEMLGVAMDYIPKIENEIILYKKGVHLDRALYVWEKAVTEGIPFDEEMIIINHKGREFWNRVYCDVVMENGKPKKLIGIFQDIDERKKIEIEADKTKILLENVLSSAKEVGIVVTGMDHILKVFNSGCENLLGYSAEEVVDLITPVTFHKKEEMVNRIVKLEKIHGRPFSDPFEIINEYSNLGLKDSNEWTFIKKDGSELAVNLILSKLNDHNGKHIGYLGIAVDLSDLNAAKSGLELLSNNLQKKNEQLLNFAQITSHNLRSPVINLNSLLEIYDESESDADREEIFDQFKKVIHNLSGTLNELVETLKIQEDVNKKSTRLKFSEVFERTKETLAGQILKSKVTVTADFNAVDEINYPKSYMESIILNLFTNAIKYRSHDRKAKIHFETKRTQKGIELSVEDNGLGIDLKKNGHKLFGFNKTFHRHSEAKGLGLFMTKIQVETLGGGIYVKSKVNKGSTFFVVFSKTKINE